MTEPLASLPCADCGAPATVHSLIAVGGDKHEIHLCKECALKRHLITPTLSLDLPGIVKEAVGAVDFIPTELAKRTCPDCGIKYMDFRKQGRFGCPQDYVVFRNGILSLLERVQRATVHRGKRPRRLRGTVEAPIGVGPLRRQLRQAIDQEDFEAAARLRDQIKQKESEHGV